jgi:hypothetical protein
VRDFRASNTDERISSHRFWIESGPVPMYTQSEKRQGQDGPETETMTFGQPPMVIREHRLQMDAEGKLIDAADPKHQRWLPCFVLTGEEFDRLQAGKLFLMENGSAGKTGNVPEAIVVAAREHKPGTSRINIWHFVSNIFLFGFIYL